MTYALKIKEHSKLGVSPAHRSLRQEDHEFEVSLDYNKMIHYTIHTHMRVCTHVYKHHSAWVPTHMHA